MDFEAIKKAAEGYKPAMVKFLRDMIAIPSESCEEKGVVHRIAEEMKALGYDKVEFDKLGNVIGWMGEGDKIIALDSHVDTVGIGNRDNWEADPYQGYETDDIIYGRGGSDQEGGMASATYGARIMKDLGLIPAGYKIMVVGSVQEEDCDGMCWQSIVNEYFNGPEDARSKVEFVISTEPTDGGIYRATVAAWRSVWICTVCPATAPPRSVATTPSTRWPRSSRTSGISTKIPPTTPWRSRVW